MAIERKKIVTKQEPKKVHQTGNKLKKSFNFASLPDAIVDGKFLGEVGSKIIVERLRSGKSTLSICVVQEVNEKGLVHTFDETIEQCFSFSISQAPKIVKIYN